VEADEEQDWVAAEVKIYTGLLEER